MEAIKGIARRTTQSFREKLTHCETTGSDEHVTEVAKKVRALEAKSTAISEKVIRAARLMEELGVTLKEIGEEYKTVPDLAAESRQLAEDVTNVGAKLVETSSEHQRGLKDNGFDVLRQFAKQCTKLTALEETQRHHQLEYDYFRAKVLQLRQSPQKDFTRIPRNEQIMENWRVELWRVTENYKSLLSALYLEGRRAVDCSVLTTVQVLNSFVDIASTGFKQTFYNARLPEYPAEPVLAPQPLPPNPLPPQSGVAGLGAGGPSNFGLASSTASYAAFGQQQQQPGLGASQSWGGPPPGAWQPTASATVAPPTQTAWAGQPAGCSTYPAGPPAPAPQPAAALSPPATYSAPPPTAYQPPPAGPAPSPAGSATYQPPPA